MRVLLILLFIGLVSFARASCDLKPSTTEETWTSDFNLVAVEIPSVVLKTRITFDSDGSFSSVSSYQGCYLNANGTFTFDAPSLVFTVLASSDLFPDANSVACNIMAAAQSAIGDPAYLPASNVTFNSACNTWNMTFIDSVGLAETRTFVQGSSAFVLLPSIVFVIIAVFVNFI